MSEKDWANGYRTAWRSIAGRVASELDPQTDEDKSTQERLLWLAERHDVVRALRELCEELGCNDWPDNLYLADVIEKHVGRSDAVRQWMRDREREG